jgi:hypothetical protein
MYVRVRLRPHSDLKILMTPRVQKRTQIYFLLSQKSQQMNPLQVPQQGPYREGGPFTGHLAYLSKTYLPGSPVKKFPPRPPPQSLFRERDPIHRAPSSSSQKSPVDGPSSRYPKRGPYEKRCPSPEPFLHIFQGPQQGSPPFRFPSQSSQRERHSTPRDPFNHISKSLVDQPTPGCPTEPP